MSHFKISHNQTVRSLQILNHLLLFIGLYFAYKNPSLLLVSLITFWVIGVLGINIGYHRLLSHRSFSTHPLVEKFLAVVGCLTTVGSPLAWVALHRAHHRHSDQPKDPHDPRRLGAARAWLGIWKKVRLSPRIVSDLRKSPFYRFCHNYYFLIIGFYCLVLALINPLYIIFVYAIPACLCLHSTSVIIVVAHFHGYRTHQTNDKSLNSWIASLVTLGEGWHNNHHAHPYRWKQGEKWWELDPPAWIISMIRVKK